jgi:hypothetical protein
LRPGDSSEPIAPLPSRYAGQIQAGLKDPRRPASLMHACIAVSLMAGVRPEEARAIGWEEDVDLDGVLVWPRRIASPASPQVHPAGRCSDSSAVGIVAHLNTAMRLAGRSVAARWRI